MSPAARKSLSTIWLSDPAAYPIFAVIGGAVLLCAGASTRYLTKCPDVQWNKSNRQNCLHENVAESTNWVAHKQPIAYSSANCINENSQKTKVGLAASF